MSYLGLNLAFRNDNNTTSLYTQTGVTYDCAREFITQWFRTQLVGEGEDELCDKGPSKSNTVCER